VTLNRSVILAAGKRIRPTSDKARVTGPPLAAIGAFDSVGARHSEIRAASRGWVVDVYDPDGLTVRLYSTGDDAEDHTNQPGYGQTV